MFPFSSTLCLCLLFFLYKTSTCTAPFLFHNNTPKYVTKNVACVITNSARITFRDIPGRGVKSMTRILVIIVSSKTMAAVARKHLKATSVRWAVGAAGCCVLTTGRIVEDVHAASSCCTCMCAHARSQLSQTSLHTQHAIVNSWQGFYCCITPDTQRERR